MKRILRILLISAVVAAWIYTQYGKDEAPVQQPPSTQTKKVKVAQISPEQRISNKELVPEAWPPVVKNENSVESDLLKKNYYVILDNSGSMKDQQCYGAGSKISVAVDAIAHFASLVPDKANLGLSIFTNSIIQEAVPLGTDNRNLFIDALENVNPSGGTPLATAMQSGYRKLTEQASRQMGYGEYYLVIVTDGIPSEGEDPTAIVHAILDNTPIEIHTIGFCIGEDHALNIPGRTVYKAANNQEDLKRGLQDILAESELFDLSDFSLSQ
ncbi:vWA domain-containing protein [Desulfogranum japonicum]|uniref:vWA domain-containing protein n=1 Tax=Desulfogranum japonicum TaxID=231447 RepID=UPI0004199126|nr:vWA domain-containing protein [Desulfogranum japonicum]